MRALLALALFALIGTAMAQNWFHTVTYTDSTCSEASYISYTSSKAGNCVKNGPNTWAKFDCGSFRGSQCSDDKCTSCTGEVDFSSQKECRPTALGSTYYIKGFCNGLSSPYPSTTQFQYRTYPIPSVNNALDCTTPMVTVVGSPADKCFLALGANRYSKYTCAGNVPTISTGCDANCNNCESRVQQTLTCNGGIAVACGVGAASGVVVSIATIVVIFISAIFVL